MDLSICLLDFKTQTGVGGFEDVCGAFLNHRVQVSDDNFKNEPVHKILLRIDLISLDCLSYVKLSSPSCRKAEGP